MIAGALWQGLVQNAAVNRLAAALNALPLPYHRLPLKVRGRALAADSLDRFLYLLLEKLRARDAYAVELLRGLARPGCLAIDVGANLGLYALALAEAVGSGGAVLAVEPDPANHRLLLRNLAANACPQVTPVAAMAGAERGEGMLYPSKSNRGDHRSFASDAGRKGIPVPRLALDDLVPAGRPVDLVKLDVQGYEGHVLAGMGRILRESPDLKLLVEFWPYGLDRSGYGASAFLARLSALGFRLRIADGKARALRPADPDAVLAAAPGKGYVDLLCERRA